jgi:hypothetical protein
MAIASTVAPRKYAPHRRAFALQAGIDNPGSHPFAPSQKLRLM